MNQAPESGSTLESRRLQSEYSSAVRTIADSLQEFAEGLNPAVTRFMQMSAALRGHVSDAIEPFNVAVFGRMKTGKSTLINALVGRRLAITGVNEATATINRLTYATGGEQLATFKAHWREASPETFPLEKLATEWTGTEPDVLERIRQVKYLELFADAEWLRDVQVTDTPGTGSTTCEHEAIAQQFINGREADALVYVFPPVAREKDEDDLQSFRRSCLPGSDPYNSVAVMHKWDETYWASGGDWADIEAKAARLYSHMTGLVSCVVPVSGPLALAAEMDGGDFWDNLLALLSTFRDEGQLTAALGMDRLWKMNPAQGALYEQAKQKYGMPWASFRVMLREIYRSQCKDGESARNTIAELGGIRRMREILDKQFFKKSAVIRLNRTRSRVQGDVDNLRDAMERAGKDVEDEAGHLRAITECLEDARMRSWVENRIHKMNAELDNMNRAFIEIDRTIIATGGMANQKSDTVALVPWLAAHSRRFSSPQQVALLQDLLRFSSKIPDDQVEGVYRTVSTLAMDMDPDTRAMAQKLQDILMQSLQD